MSRPVKLAAITVAVVAVCAVLGTCWLGLGREYLPVAAAAGRRLTTRLSAIARFTVVATVPSKASPGNFPENLHTAQAEHEILALLAAGDRYVRQWDIEKAEESLAKAARLAEQRLQDLGKGHAADPPFRRLSLLAVDAITQLGTFRTRYGEPSEAVPQL